VDIKMNKRILCAVSAIALLSSGTAYATPTGNTATILQSSGSAHAEAAIDQILSDGTSAATIIQTDVSGTNIDRAQATITQGATSATTATNTARVTQDGTLSSDVTVTQSGTTGGTNNAYALQQNSDAVANIAITQIATGGGENRIASDIGSGVWTGDGFSQFGMGTSAVINQATSGANNFIADLYQMYGPLPTTLTVNQGQTTGSGGTNLIRKVFAEDTLLSITQDSAGTGTNTVGPASGQLRPSRASVTITQNVSGAGSNNVASSSGLVVNDAIVVINQTSTGATYGVEVVPGPGALISGGTLTINQLSASTGTGLVDIMSFSAGTGLINQTAGSSAGFNHVSIMNMVDGTGQFAVLQGGDANRTNINIYGSASGNNINDDGSTTLSGNTIVTTKTTIEQDGTSNVASLNQSTSANVAHIYQAGSYNAAIVNQTTLSGNAAYITQLGTNGTATISQ
jgi:hypothetical protein